jgi:hypothetical protein
MSGLFGLEREARKGRERKERERAREGDGMKNMSKDRLI